MKNKFRFLLASLGVSLISLTALAQTDSAKLVEHVRWLTSTKQPRTFVYKSVLDSVSLHIKSVLEPYADTVHFQDFKVFGATYRNVIASFGPRDAERIVVGAHYDVCGDQPGADDNASGVAGLLELGRMLSTDSTLKYRIDLVAYSLEEPPYFRSPSMGSFIHAKSLKDSGVKVKGMVSLEMIGFFSKARRSQQYPVGLMKLFYGGKGDYVAIVRKFSDGKFSRKFTRHTKKASDLSVKSFKGPRWLPGIDYSDHMNYWDMGISAVMITDTSFYRNRNYHQKTDTIETLDFEMMAKVVNGVYKALAEM